MLGTVLVTGPVHGLDEYADAAKAAGWNAIARPLVQVERIEADLQFDSDCAFERILITSRNAVAPLDQLATTHLELREIPCSVVGTRTARALIESGFALEGEPATDAHELAERLLKELPSESTLLWPRGSISDQLAVQLRAKGHRVLDPVVYTTVDEPDPAPVPDADAIFFASPSAVRAWRRLPHTHETMRKIAIAIGNTTRTELETETDEPFSDILVLDHPTPEALTECLRKIRLDS